MTVTADGRWLVITATLGTGKGTDGYLADLHASPPGGRSCARCRKGS